MLLHYIGLISEYQDSRRSSERRDIPSDTDTPQQDAPDMLPPPELVQSIRAAGGDLPACDAVIVHNLRQLSKQTGRDAILYAGAFRHGDRGPSPDAIINEDDIAGRSGKLARLQELLDEIIPAGDRVLIFSQFTEMGAILQQHVQETYGIETPRLHSGVSRKNRDLMVDRFQNDPHSPQVFVLSLKAGGSGLNLPQANYVIHYDRRWNPAAENQATHWAFRYVPFGMPRRTPMAASRLCASWTPSAASNTDRSPPANLTTGLPNARATPSSMNLPGVSWKLPEPSSGRNKRASHCLISSIFR